VNSRDHNADDIGLLSGCLNCTIQLSALKGFKCNPILRELGEAVCNELKAIGAAIADLRITLAPEVDVDGVATLNFAPNKPQLEIGVELDQPVERAVLNLNLRAEAKPDHIHAAVTRALNHTWAIFPQIFVRMSEMEHFRPTAASIPQSSKIAENYR
jgi:hypothetical protein